MDNPSCREVPRPDVVCGAVNVSPSQLILREAIAGRWPFRAAWNTKQAYTISTLSFAFDSALVKITVRKIPSTKVT